MKDDDDLFEERDEKWYKDYVRYNMAKGCGLSIAAIIALLIFFLMLLFKQ